MLKRTCRNVRTLCPVTRQLGEAIARNGVKTEIQVIPNVVNTALFQPALKPSAGKKKILHISTLNEKQKNISGLLRVIKRLSEMRNDFEMEIISEHDFEAARQFAGSIGLKDDILRFRGLQPIEEVARTMQQASVFVLFSNEENLPCVLLESVSCGTPVISTRVGGISEWINESCGMLIEKGDEAALLNALNKTLDETNQFQAERMHQYIQETFSYQSISQKFNELYSQK
jgi:glycosyltransferase involved in cell wall biosynthesis